METATEPALTTAPPPDRVFLTDGAVLAIGKLLRENDMPGFGLRFGIQGGGCSGYMYQLEFEEAAQPDDLVFDYSGVKVFVNPLQMEYVRGSTIDYRDELIGAGFHIENPNVKRSCGCGSSFDV